MLFSAREAADRLGIKLDTLYAYVSRGRLRSVMVPGTRERRYRSEDVQALLDGRSGTRPQASPDPEAIMPVIGSSICLIENGRFYYRGRDAVRLSEEADLEEIRRRRRDRNRLGLRQWIVVFLTSLFARAIRPVSLRTRGLSRSSVR